MSKTTKLLIIIFIPIFLSLLYQGSVYLADSCFFKQCTVKKTSQDSEPDSIQQKLLQEQEYKEYNKKLEQIETYNKECKDFIFIRHGEGKHQFKKFKNLRDPILTEKGKQQVLEVRQKIEEIDFDVVYLSPMSRTVESACYLFQDYLQKKKNLRFVMAPKLKEMLFNPNNNGREGKELKEIYGEKCFLGQQNKSIFDDLPQRWSDIQNKQLNKNFVKEGYQKQFNLLVKEIYRDFSDAKTVGIVGHSQFFKLVTPDNHAFKNAEIRKYRYCNDQLTFVE
ncbi:hypothetical protein PPERSA_10878 [Pseudocohnilembus persalinus]|uniref:Histidine phosphatase superfamily, clade-1 n=1 Tax=Pseudocohnilembus persalinus TaxID=266149 RepID=A0A0V0R6T1_PSEPJ|nr:hypothetical protein PPERSA_10878 [Pseudocohnilembus persalinus]|eukprot:KRX10212.1 hypothetical protein PPERSA_10878 [Pseudocohnilembus persalinus]